MVNPYKVALYRASASSFEVGWQCLEALLVSVEAQSGDQSARSAGKIIQVVFLRSGSALVASLHI